MRYNSYVVHVIVSPSAAAVRGLSRWRGIKSGKVRVRRRSGHKDTNTRLPPGWLGFDSSRDQTSVRPTFSKQKVKRQVALAGHFEHHVIPVLTVLILTGCFLCLNLTKTLHFEKVTRRPFPKPNRQLDVIHRTRHEKMCMTFCKISYKRLSWSTSIHDLDDFRAFTKQLLLKFTAKCGHSNISKNKQMQISW